MSTKAGNNGKSESSGANTFLTDGETFGDGTMIELISGDSALNKPSLLLWNGRKATVGPRVEHHGRIYEAPELSPSLRRAMRLPSRCSDYGSTHGLFAEITNLFKRHLNLPEHKSKLLACFSVGTWVADRLPTAPTLMISGPEPELGVEMLRLLSCFCRHPLLLAEVTPSGFRALPMQLSLTLLVNQPGFSRNMQRLFRASSYRGLHLPGSRGTIVDLYGPKALFCGNDAEIDTLSSGVIYISTPPSQLRLAVLDEQAQNEIANGFQPRLLMYRLKNVSKVSASRIDVSHLTFATRSLARTLAMCFPENSGLACDVVQLLASQEEEVREQCYFDINYVIVEILLGMIHARERREVGVGELAKNVNALLRSLGGNLEYRAEEIGWKLRDLNIHRHSSGSGRQVLLEGDTSQRVHRLARDYDLSGWQHVKACKDCDKIETPVFK